MKDIRFVNVSALNDHNGFSRFVVDQISVYAPVSPLVHCQVNCFGGTGAITVAVRVLLGIAAIDIGSVGGKTAGGRCGAPHPQNTTNTTTDNLINPEQNGILRTRGYAEDLWRRAAYA